MIPNIKFKLKEIIDMHLLQNIQDKFSDIVGLCSIILDENGTPIANSGSFSSFFSFIRNSEDGYKEYIKSDADGVEMAEKSIEAQINPHFLFNTLNTIARMALFENAPNTEKLVYTISELLRYSLKNTNSMVDIDSEISNIKKFFDIQKLKYDDLFNYKIDVEPPILFCKIPIMILQPLAEISIINILKSMNKNAKIIIKGRKNEDGNLQIVIFDNGTGVYKEKPDIMYPSNDSHKKIKIFGITNVDKKIKYFYGNDYGVEIRHVKDFGTFAIIKIPCTESKERWTKTFV